MKLKILLCMCIAYPLCTVTEENLPKLALTVATTDCTNDAQKLFTFLCESITKPTNTHFDTVETTFESNQKNLKRLSQEFEHENNREHWKIYGALHDAKSITHKALQLEKSLKIQNPDSDLKTQLTDLISAARKKWEGCLKTTANETRNSLAHNPSTTDYLKRIAKIVLVKKTSTQALSELPPQ